MSDCPFCGLIEDSDPKLVGLSESQPYWRLEPLNPVVPGHMIFISEHYTLPHENRRITGHLFDFAAGYAGEQGGDYNLIVNAGSAASQTVPHVHVHYVPRREGDGLTLPWTGQVKS